MNCQEAKRWLGPYCDRELDLPRALEVEVHLKACPDCERARQNLLSLTRHVRAAAFEAPAALRRSLTSQQAPAPALPPRPRFLSWFQIGMGAATASLLIGLVAFQLVARVHQQHLLTELADDHMRSLVANHLVDVPSSDRHTVRPWFEGKIDFAPPVPDLSVAGYPLVGGRLDYVEGHPAAALIYQFNKHYISVFVRPESPARTQAPVLLPSQRGYQIIAWQSGDLIFRAVSEIPERDLRDFATAFQSNAQNR